MGLQRISRILLDYPPRQLLHIARTRWLKQKQPGTFNDERPCVFVLSTGRTGTQTLAALYELASNVFAYHEPNPELTALSKLAYEFEDQYKTDAVVGKLFREAVLTSRNPLLTYSLDCGRGYVETTPQNTFLAPVIRDVLPYVRFIHLTRDPRYVVRSAMRRKWYDGNANDADRILPIPTSEAGQKWDTYGAFQKNLWLWVETNRWSMEFASDAPERVCRVQAEALFSGDKIVLDKLFAFINAPVPSERKINRILGNKLNAQRTGAFPEYSDWSAEMLGDLHTFTDQMAALLGYDLNAPNL